MEDTQNHNPVAVVAILKYVRTAQHLHHDLPVFFPCCEWTTEFRMSFEDLRPKDDFFARRLPPARAPGREETRRSDRGRRAHRPTIRGLLGLPRTKSGVPHVRSQRTTPSCGTVGAPASIFFQRRSSSAISSESATTGTVSSVASSATNSGTVTPSSAARVLSTRPSARRPRF